MGFSALVSFYKEIEAAALAWPHTDICAPLEEDLSQVAMPSWTKKSMMLFFAGFCHNIFYLKISQTQKGREGYVPKTWMDYFCTTKGY